MVEWPIPTFNPLLPGCQPKGLETELASVLVVLSFHRISRSPPIAKRCLRGYTQFPWTAPASVHYMNQNHGCIHGTPFAPTITSLGESKTL